jgi:hypothetical protein
VGAGFYHLLVGVKDFGEPNLQGIMKYLDKVVGAGSPIASATHR